jgi:hypothetical protein
MNFIKTILIFFMTRNLEKKIGLPAKNSTEGACILVKRDRNNLYGKEAQLTVDKEEGDNLSLALTLR